MNALKYTTLPGLVKEMDNFNAFKNKLEQFRLLHTFYSVEEFVSC
jgi:hypothetical protein